MVEIDLRPVGVIRAARAEVIDDFWGSTVSTIEIDPDQFTEDALKGLEEFSHLEIVFFLNRVDPAAVETGSRHPRGNTSWPEVGIFAQRAKWRPNRLAVSRCRLLRREGMRLLVEDLDAIDGTPVLDVKPWMEEFGPRGEVRQPLWSHELMADYYAVSPGDDACGKM